MNCPGGGLVENNCMFRGPTSSRQTYNITAEMPQISAFFFLPLLESEVPYHLINSSCNLLRSKLSSGTKVTAQLAACLLCKHGELCSVSQDPCEK